jgi:hypothetical protein
VRVEPLETAGYPQPATYKVMRNGQVYRVMLPGLGRGLYRLLIDRRTPAAIVVDPLSTVRHKYKHVTTVT